MISQRDGCGFRYPQPLKAPLQRLIWYLVISGVLFTGCRKKRTEAEMDASVLNGFRKMDAFLRNDQFDYDSMNTYLDMMQHEFVHSTTRKEALNDWTATVTYWWNGDSTLTLIHAYNTYKKGFLRERILHCGDSILFLHRFSTEPLGQDRSDRFTFLESIYYLTEYGTIQHLARIRYNQEYLEDTVSFRSKPFGDLRDEVSHYYSLELNHSRNLLTGW